MKEKTKMSMNCNLQSVGAAQNHIIGNAYLSNNNFFPINFEPPNKNMILTGHPYSWGLIIFFSTIAFKGSDDGTIEQRAWDNLLPNRILMYCK